MSELKEKNRTLTLDDFFEEKVITTDKDKELFNRLDEEEYQQYSARREYARITGTKVYDDYFEIFKDNQKNWEFIYEKYKRMKNE